MVQDSLLACSLEASDNGTNPSGSIAEHERYLIWRVALLDQPQEMPMRALDGMGCAAVAGMQLFRCEFGLDGYSFRHACSIHHLNGFDMIGSQLVVVDEHAHPVCGPLLQKIRRFIEHSF